MTNPYAPQPAPELYSPGKPGVPGVPGTPGAPGAGPGVAPRRPARPPLTRRARTGSIVAGIVGFGLTSLGWALISIPITILAIGGLFYVLLAGMSRASDGRFGDLTGWMSQLSIEQWWPLVVGAILVGVLLWVAGLLISSAILRRTGSTRPWAITWAGLGIAVVGSWIVGGVGSSIGSFSFSGLSSDDVGAAGLVLVIVTGVSSIVFTLAAGAFSWWWMAHALRPSAPVGEVPPAAPAQPAAPQPAPTTVPQHPAPTSTPPASTTD